MAISRVFAEDLIFPLIRTTSGGATRWPRKEKSQCRPTLSSVARPKGVRAINEPSMPMVRPTVAAFAEFDIPERNCPSFMFLSLCG